VLLLLLSTSDTDLMSARSADGPVSWRYANPTRLSLSDLPGLCEGTSLVVVRLLGGRRAWDEGLDQLLAGTRPVVVLTGEQAPDAELMGLSTVPAGVAAQAHAYLAHGGPANLEQLACFLSDTVLLTGEGFDAPAPAPAPAWGRLDHPDGGAPSDAPSVAVLYYRAHHMSGNTHFVTTLCEQIDKAGGRPLPIWCASLRDTQPELLAALGEADVIVTTVLAAGGSTPAKAQAGGDESAWDAGALAALDRPVLQGLCLTSDLYILDEFTYPMKWGWVDVDEVVQTLVGRPGHQHVVITGRDAPPELIEAADLVTEMTKVKHPMDAGQKGQRGIEW